jgi:hypothetical protein
LSPLLRRDRPDVPPQASAKDWVPRTGGTEDAPAPAAKGIAQSKYVNLIFSSRPLLAEIFYFCSRKVSMRSYRRLTIHESLELVIPLVVQSR